MLSLTDPAWATLYSNYGGGGERVAALLALARRGAPLDDWYEELSQSLCHQYTLSEAAYGALPHLVSIAAENEELRADLLLLAGFCVACAQLPGSPAVPAGLEPAWRAAAADAVPLLGEVLQQAQPNEALFRHLLSALAALNGHYGLSFVLEALDCEVECPDCGSLVDPMTSNLNPLAHAGDG